MAPNSDEDLRKLAVRLFAQRSEAVPLAHRTITLAGWKPAPQECHRNVDELVAMDGQYKPVRGWTVAEYLPLGFVTFFAHSVVEAPDGGLMDITPHRLPYVRDYPFIRHDGSEKDFADLVDRRGVKQIDYPLP